MRVIKEYGNVIVYLLRFIFLYLIFIQLYNLYLSFFKGDIDPFTRITATAVRNIYRFFHLDSQVIPTQNEGIRLLINGKYVARIVEGCNAISLIILFAVFVLSFGKLKRGVIKFVLWGSVTIVLFNILRIALLGYILYAFPQYQDFWHRIVFPATIYGWIVFLWIFFINKFMIKDVK